MTRRDVETLELFTNKIIRAVVLCPECLRRESGALTCRGAEGRKGRNGALDRPI